MPVVADELDLCGVVEDDLACVEDGVLVGIQEEFRRAILEHGFPFAEVEESVMEGDPGGDAVLLNQLCSFSSPIENFLDVQGKHVWFVGEAVNGDDIFVPVLRKEFGNFVLEVKRTMGILLAIASIQPVNAALSPAMVEAILTTGEAMWIELYSQTILATIFDGAEEIAPGSLGNIRLAVDGVHCPVGKRNPNVVESSIADIDEVLFCDESCVVFFKHITRGTS